MTGTLQQKLEWVIPLLKKWKDSGELRHRDSEAGEWKPWLRIELPMFCDPQENYRVLPAWAWKLVDAERGGKTIQFDDGWLGWVDVEIKDCLFHYDETRYQIKPVPEPVAKSDLSTQSVWEKLRWLNDHHANLQHFAITSNMQLVNRDVANEGADVQVWDVFDVLAATYPEEGPFVSASTPEAAVDAAIEKLMPKKESPRCQCNNLKMLYLFGGSSFGYWCPHMGDSALTDVVAQHIAWQELNELPDWLCKYRREKQE